MSNLQTIEKVVPSADMVRTSGALNKVTALLSSLNVVSHEVNAFLEHADHEHYLDAVRNRDKMAELIPSSRCLQAVDPLVYEAREILFNRVSVEHKDTADPPHGWAVLTAFGTSEGVIFSVPELNLRITFEPGDMICIRGRILTHGTSKWPRGQRIVIPHFTHTSQWRALDKHAAAQSQPSIDPTYSPVKQKLTIRIPARPKLTIRIPARFKPSLNY